MQKDLENLANKMHNLMPQEKDYWTFQLAVYRDSQSCYSQNSSYYQILRQQKRQERIIVSSLSQVLFGQKENAQVKRGVKAFSLASKDDREMFCRIVLDGSPLRTKTSFKANLMQLAKEMQFLSNIDKEFSSDKEYFLHQLIHCRNLKNVVMRYDESVYLKFTKALTSALTKKLSKMDSKVQNTISALDLLRSTYEQAINQVKESQQTSLTSIVQSLTGIPAAQLDTAFTEAIASISVSVSDWFSDLLNNITTYLLDTASLVLSFCMGLIITFLLLKDKELIAKTSKRMTYAYHSRKNAEEIITITRRTNDMLNQFVISNLIVMFIIFAIAWVGFAFLMALILGLLSIIPYLGGFIASVPLAIVTLMYGDTSTMLIAVAFGLLDWALVTTFIPAIVMSKRMNTRAILIILGLTIGGAMFGIVGMILSAPVVAVLARIWQERLKIRESNKEHEELVEAGMVDAQYFGVTEILDLTQDTSYNVPIEEYEDDFKRLQAEKYLLAQRSSVEESGEEKLKVKKTTRPRTKSTE